MFFVVIALNVNWPNSLRTQNLKNVQIHWLLTRNGEMAESDRADCLQ